MIPRQSNLTKQGSHGREKKECVFQVWNGYA